MVSLEKLIRFFSYFKREKTNQRNTNSKWEKQNTKRHDLGKIQINDKTKKCQQNLGDTTTFESSSHWPSKYYYERENPCAKRKITEKGRKSPFNEKVRSENKSH